MRLYADTYFKNKGGKTRSPIQCIRIYVFICRHLLLLELLKPRYKYRHRHLYVRRAAKSCVKWLLT